MIFDSVAGGYFQNLANVWTAVTGTNPLGAEIYDSIAGGYFQNLANVWTAVTGTNPLGAELYYTGVAPASYVQNIANVWTAVAGTNPLNSLIQVGTLAYVNQNNVWVGGIAPFTDGQFVFNEADGKTYKLAAGAWGAAPADRATYVYPNGQEAAPVWFHDHMLGATRLNVYAGIAGGYVITETPPPSPPACTPSASATQADAAPLEPTIPLIIQDRMFDTNGQLFFPNVGINPEHPYWVPEFVGDTIVVNGKAWPFLNVQPQRYKFLFLNGSNARA